MLLTPTRPSLTIKLLLFVFEHIFREIFRNNFSSLFRLYPHCFAVSCKKISVAIDFLKENHHNIIKIAKKVLFFKTVKVWYFCSKFCLLHKCIIIQLNETCRLFNTPCIGHLTAVLFRWYLLASALSVWVGCFKCDEQSSPFYWFLP